ncbi:hypothetical protein AB0F81_46055 [Actinoplanes sp. NPDC024001]|uniref:hypothetical protein n=1 Tax=Actinoplanes sp. NPDC024001 TaxID=3154598 RepID=UPI0033CDACB1
MERLPSDGERTLRVGGYVTRCVKSTETPRAADPAGITWPNISDYWPDAPHRQRAAAVAGEVERGPVEDRPAGPGPAHLEIRVIGDAPVSPRRRRLRTLLGAGAAVVTVAVCGVVVAQLADRPTAPADLAAATPTPPTATPGAVLPVVPETVVPSAPAEAEAEPTRPPQPTRTPSRKPTAPAAPAAPPPLENAAFEMVDGVTDLSVRTAELDEPFQVRTPHDSGLQVRPAFADGVLRVRATPSGSGGSGRVEVLLSDDVTWRLRMTGGVARASFDLAAGTVRRIDLTGGAAEISMRLGRQAATVPIRMAGGVSAWNIRTSARVPVRVVAGSGGSRVDLYGRVTDGLAAGSVVRSGDLDDGRGLDLDAEGGFSALTVTED